MKKLLLLAAVAFGVMAQTAKADDEIWKRNYGITVGILTHQGLTAQDYDLTSMANGVIPHLDSKFGFSFTASTSYLWPRSEGWAGDRIKVGVDVRWFDLTFVKYKNDPTYDALGSIGDILNGNYNYNDYIEDMEEEEFNLDPMQLNMSVGIGPVVSVIPFSDADNGLRFLRANIYGHFMPGASALINKDAAGDTHASWAFVPTWDLGINFQWKYFVLGFEGRWASAKYKDLISEDEESWDETGYIGGDTKTKYKNASFRINLGFRF